MSDAQAPAKLKIISRGPRDTVVTLDGRKVENLVSVEVRIQRDRSIAVLEIYSPELDLEADAVTPEDTWPVLTKPETSGT